MQSLHQMQQTHSEPAHSTRIVASNQQQQMHIQQPQHSPSLELDHESHQQLSSVSSQQRTQDDSVATNSSMTILEPVQQQPLLSVLNPVAQHQAPPLIHHMGQQQQPQLHQLQAPNQQPSSGDLVHLDHEQQQQRQHIESPHHDQQQPGSDCSAGQYSSRAQHQQPRPHQIEGIVADGGGPIVQWLLENYEIADGESLPRSTVYNHYLAHCRQLQMSSVNAASFGKLIRSVFVGLKTRRLGTRGHSKYHYFGVRAKQHVRLDWIRELESGGDQQQQHSHQHHHCHHHLHETTSSNGQPENRAMTDTTNGSESDSMECNSPAKRFKRHQATTFAHQAASQRAGVGIGQNNQMLLSHSYDALETHQSGCSGQACGGDELGCTHQHHQSASDEHGTAANNNLMYTNGYGAYYSSSSNGIYNNVEQQQTSMSMGEKSSAENEHGLSGKSGWPTAEATAAAGSMLDNYNDDVFTCDFAHFRTYLGGQTPEDLVSNAWPSIGLMKFDNEETNRDNKGDKNESSCLLLERETFENRYKEHLKRFVSNLAALDFSSAEDCVTKFWRCEHNLNKHNGRQQSDWSGENIELNSNLHDQDDKQNDQQGDFIFERLKNYTCSPSNAERIVLINRRIYQALETFLMPSLFVPIPGQLTQLLRMFARNFPNWLEESLKHYPNRFRMDTSKAAREFAHTIRRCASINYLAAASRAIWTKRPALAQMSADLSRIDLRDIELQVSLMVQQQQQREQTQLDDDMRRSNELAISNQQQSSLDRNNFDERTNSLSGMINNDGGTSSINNNNNNENFVHHSNQEHKDDIERLNDLSSMQTSQPITLEPGHLIQSLLKLLNEMDPINEWPVWCQRLLETRVNGGSFEEARNFVLRWNFVVSLIFKELTLKSAPSLGSFQLIRLLFDEYIYYLVFSKLDQTQDPKTNPATNLLLRPSSRFAGND